MLIEYSTPSRCAFLIGDEKMELNEKEAHCIARLLQGAIYGNSKNVFDGCQFCKFKCRTEKDPAPFFNEIMYKLRRYTGVYLGAGSSYKWTHLDFPYERFLINSNEEMQEKLKDYFK